MDYRKIYAEHYGIRIPKDYDIHHIDLNHDNNNLENLILIPHELHMRLHKCINGGLVSIAAETLQFRFCVMPSHCNASAYHLKQFAEVYDELTIWSSRKDFEDRRLYGYDGYMPFDYNEFRNE